MRMRKRLDRLSGIADAFLIGERPIARRVDDSVARAGVFGPVILRRSRGYAPCAVATVPIDDTDSGRRAPISRTPSLWSCTARPSSASTSEICDNTSLARVSRNHSGPPVHVRRFTRKTLIVAHDAHPQYLVRTVHALESAGAASYAIQHHRAHIASVLAERAAWEKRVVGVSFDGTGYRR